MFIMVFVPVSCFYMDEAKIVNLDDETYINPTVPPGEITELTVKSISAPTKSNPVIVITFNVPVTQSSVIYGTTIIVEVEDDFGNSVVGHSLVPVNNPASNLNINLPALENGYTVSVILEDIVAYANSNITLPYTFNEWVIP